MVTANAKDPRKPSKRGFYQQALGEAEQAAFGEALQVGGIDEEIAALRLRLRATLAGGSEELGPMLRGMEVLRRMVATKYGLSKEDERDLASAFAKETLRRMRTRGKGGKHDDPA